MLLTELAAVFARNRGSILDHKLPLKTTADDAPLHNDMIIDALDVDIDSLLLKAEVMYHQLKNDQLHSYTTILDRIRAGKPGLLFVFGYGGTGKTFLWDALYAYLRGNKRIVLSVAS